MELLLGGGFGLISFGLFLLYVYAFVLLWKDEQFNDLFKLAGTVLFLTVFPAAWVYLIYRACRN